MMLLAGAFPRVHTGYFLSALVLVIATAVVWLILVIRAIRRKQFLRIIAAVPMIVFFAMAMTLSGTVERLVFQLAKPTLEQALQDGTCPSWAGIMPIEDCRPMGGNSGRVFVVNTEPLGLLVLEAGWVNYGAEEFERERRNLSNRNLGGGWYSVQLK